MAKKHNNNRKIFNSKMWLVVACTAVVLVGAASVIAVSKADDNDDPSQIRELILQAVRGTKKNAPVEAQTGDIYFPESRLYLPNPESALPLTYAFDAGDANDEQTGLSVSTYPVRGTTAMYQATDIDGLFEAVPKLQSCSRGVKLVYTPYSDDNEHELRHTVQLSNGKNLHIYTEKACPELKDTADLLKDIRAY